VLKALCGVRYGEGCPLPSHLGGLASVMSSTAGSGAEPRSEWHWCILNATERSFLHLHVDALSSSYSSGEQLPVPQRKTATVSR